MPSVCELIGVYEEKYWYFKFLIVNPKNMLETLNTKGIEKQLFG